MTSPNERNARIIDEFRNNNGNVGGAFQGIPLLLLHTTGARSGVGRVNSVAYQHIDGRTRAVFASKGGAPTNPDWYYNLLAQPDDTIEVGVETMPARARVATGDERERIWSKQKQNVPTFADYELKTDREIPVVVIEPR